MIRNSFITSTVFCVFLFFLCAFKTTSLVAQAPFPGKVVAESPDPLNNSYASPGIVILSDGSYLASHDITSTITALYKSDDEGANWKLISLVKDSHWSSLFLHNNDVYLLGVSRSFNNIVIHKSADGGNNWTSSVDENSGVLVEGRFHTAPTPVVVHNGRVWKAFEESPDPDNERDFHAFVLSAPVGSDLLKASSWKKSTSVALNPNWFNADNPEWCEGNVVIAPDGKIVNIIRMATAQAVNGTLEMNGYATGIPRYEVAAKLEVSADGQTTSFNPATGFIHFPGAMTKFTIRYDAASGKYWSIVNKITTVFSGWGNGSSNGPWNQRNVLMLVSSTDLENWQEEYKIIRWNEGELITRRANFGFQYVDWQFDGNDIVAVSRTSWFGSDWHDANLITFHRLPGFRNLTMADSPPDIGYLTAVPPAVLSWQFGSPATTGKEETINPTYSNSNLQVSALSRGTGLNAGDGFVRSFNSSSGTQHNSKANAVTRNEYFQFEVQAKPGYSVSLATIEAKLSRTSTGSKSYRWAFSKDGTNFTEIGSGEVFGMVEETEGSIQPTTRLEMYKELQNVPSSVKITFRMYVWGSSSSGGRFSIGRYGSGDTTPGLAIGGEVFETPEQETPLVGWKFDGQTGTAPNNKAAETNNSALITSNLKRGDGLTPASLNNGYYSTMPIRTKSEALAANDFYEFSVQPNSGKYMSLNKLYFKLRRNSAGPTIYRWAYSVNEGDFTELGNSDVAIIGTTDSGYIQQPINLSLIPELQNIASVHQIRFRLYAWGASSATGGFGFGRYTDDYCLAVYGTTHNNIVTAWEFSGENGGQNNDPATTLNPNVEPSNLIRGNNVAATEGSTNSFVGNFPVTTTRQQAIDAGNYFQFTAKAKAGYKMSLSSLDARIRVQANAAHHYSWRYSTDGTTFYDAGPADNTINTTINNGEAVPQINLSIITDLQNVASNQIITFRLYAWGATATTSNSFGIGKSLSSGNALIIGGVVEAEEPPLPVKWGIFTGSKEGDDVNLRWTTLSETNHSHFKVLKSIDGYSFTTLGSVEANASRNYQFTDRSPIVGYNYYQLQQVDYDGKIDLSEIITLNFSLRDSGFKVYAPIDEPYITLFVNREKSAIETVRISDLSGKVLFQGPLKLGFGENIIRLPLLLIKGIYVIQLQNEAVKFIK